MMRAATVGPTQDSKLPAPARALTEGNNRRKTVFEEERITVENLIRFPQFENLMSLRKKQSQANRELVERINLTSNHDVRAQDNPIFAKYKEYSSEAKDTISKIVRSLRKGIPAEMRGAIKESTGFTRDLQWPSDEDLSTDPNNISEKAINLLGMLSMLGILTYRYIKNVPIADMEVWVKLVKNDKFYRYVKQQFHLLATWIQAEKMGVARKLDFEELSTLEEKPQSTENINTGLDTSRISNAAQPRKDTNSTQSRKESEEGEQYQITDVDSEGSTPPGKLSRNQRRKKRQKERRMAQQFSKPLFTTMEDSPVAEKPSLRHNKEKGKVRQGKGETHQDYSPHRNVNIQMNRLRPDIRLSYANVKRPQGIFVNELEEDLEWNTSEEEESEESEEEMNSMKSFSSFSTKKEKRSRASERQAAQLIIEYPNTPEYYFYGGNKKKAKEWLQRMTIFLKKVQPKDPVRVVRDYIKGGAKDWLHIVYQTYRQPTWTQFVQAFKARYTGVKQTSTSKFYSLTQNRLSFYEFLLKLLRYKDESGLELSDQDLVKRLIQGANSKQEALEFVKDKKSIQDILDGCQWQHNLLLELEEEYPAKEPTSEKKRPFKTHNVSFLEDYQKEEEEETVTEIPTKVEVPTMAPVNTESIVEQLKSYIDKQVFMINKKDSAGNSNNEQRMIERYYPQPQHIGAPTVPVPYQYIPMAPVSLPGMEPTSQASEANPNVNNLAEMTCDCCGMKGHTKKFCHSRCRLCDKSHKKPSDLCEAATWLGKHKKDMQTMFGNDLPDWFEPMMENLNFQSHQ